MFDVRNRICLICVKENNHGEGKEEDEKGGPFWISSMGSCGIQRLDGWIF